MPIENNGTSQKLHMTNTPPEIDKYDTHKNWFLKRYHFCEILFMSDTTFARSYF